MSDNRSSRTLSDRVEIDFHERGNRFRRLTWWVALVAAVLCVAWLGFAAARHEHRIYEAGAVITAHRMIENKCERCHTTWGPLRRLFTMDSSITSVDDSGCIECHAGMGHHVSWKQEGGEFVRDENHAFVLSDKQPVPHDGLHCADCHREHQGDIDLTALADALCVNCHGDMQAAGHTAQVFANNVSSFDAGADGHPAFAFETLVGTTKEAKDTPHSVFRNLELMQRGPEDPVIWQDAARIAFNHSKHLQETGIFDGTVNDDGTAGVRVLNCADCHEYDEQRRYIKPIRYDAHCRDCHELHFDADHPKATVPHATREVVQGALIRFYAGELTDDIRDPSEQRARPGQRHNIDLTEAEQAVVDEASDTALGAMLNHSVEFDEGTGRWKPRMAPPSAGRADRYVRGAGCSYCHEVTQEAESLTAWKVTSPNIPERWLPHSRFNHDTHRSLDCRECHQNFLAKSEQLRSITESTSTGDVLLPTKELCVKCHSESGVTRPAGVMGARTSCVECHTYHKRSDEPPGKLSIHDFVGSASTKTGTP